MGPGHPGGHPPAGECLEGGQGLPHGCPQPRQHPQLSLSTTTPLPQDLENPMHVPVGWLRRGDVGDLVELSGDEDEAPRVTEGAGAPGRVGGPRGGAGLRAGVAVTVTAPWARCAPRCPPRP